MTMAAVLLPLRLIYLMFSFSWRVGLELRTRSDTTKEIEIGPA